MSSGREARLVLCCVVLVGAGWDRRGDDDRG